MRRLLNTAAVALGLTAAAAGPAQAAAPLGRPADFRLRFVHLAGSVAPPYHDEWAVTAGPSLRGTIVYVPDYPGRGVPRWVRSFPVSAVALDRLYSGLRLRGLLRTTWPPPGMHPIGGPVDSATATAAGRLYRVPPFAAARPTLLGYEPAVRAVVPRAVWASLRAARLAYVQRRYPHAMPPSGPGPSGP